MRDESVAAPQRKEPPRTLTPSEAANASVVSASDPFLPAPLVLSDGVPLDGAAFSPAPVLASPLLRLVGGGTPPAFSAASPAASPEAAHSRVHYLEGLVEASNAISATLEPSRVAEILVERTAEILEVPGVAVLLLDEENNLRPASAKGLSAAFLASQVGPISQSIAGRALTEKRTFATWDVKASGDTRLAQVAQAAGIAAAAAAPMFFGGKPVGSLNIYCRDTRCFSEDQFHVLSLLAAQGAIALTNAQAFRENRNRAAEVRAGFRRVGAALSSSLDVGETLHLIVQLVMDMIGADGGAMFMLQEEAEGGGMQITGMRGLDRLSVRRFRRVPISPLARRALDTGKVVIVPDTATQTDTPFPTLRAPGASIITDMTRAAEPETDASETGKVPEISRELPREISREIRDEAAENGETAPVRSVICVPVLVGGRPLGVLEQYAKTPNKFADTDVALLETFAHQASIAIENARLYSQERSVVQTLQKTFLPELPPEISGFQIGRIYAPGSEIAQVGGDTYDLLTLPDGRIAALMADASGSGTDAATLAVMAKYTVRAYTLENPDPSSVLARVNEALIPQTPDNMFLTLCYTLIDPKTRQVSIANAAHPPALLCRAGDKAARAVGGEPGLISGFLHNETYPSETFTLGSGDVLVFYTDGVVEARWRKIQFGQEKLEALIGACAHLPAQAIAAAIYDEVSAYAVGERMDDIALLVLKAE